jgi:hypothetical protein
MATRSSPDRIAAAAGNTSFIFGRDVMAIHLAKLSEDRDQTRCVIRHQFAVRQPCLADAIYFRMDLIGDSMILFEPLDPRQQRCRSLIVGLAQAWE